MGTLDLDDEVDITVVAGHTGTDYYRRQCPQGQSGSGSPILRSRRRDAFRQRHQDRRLCQPFPDPVSGTNSATPTVRG